MNPKIEKLKAERDKNSEKISALQERNKKLSEQITKLENSDIIGMVREIGMPPEELAALLATRRTPAPEHHEGMEDMNHED